jgi:hypothetical protein
MQASSHDPLPVYRQMRAFRFEPIFLSLTEKPKLIRNISRKSGYGILLRYSCSDQANFFLLLTVQHAIQSPQSGL